MTTKIKEISTDIRADNTDVYTRCSYYNEIKGTDSYPSSQLFNLKHDHRNECVVSNKNI